METLNDSVTGRYVVTTSSGAQYLIDLDQMTMSRFPRADSTVARAMRGDCSDLGLVFIDDCTVGRPMHLIIDLNVPGVIVTSRWTTNVATIDAELPDGGAPWTR